MLESGVKSVSDAYDAGKKLRFKEEEERKNMVRIAEMQKQVIKEEAQKLEGMASWKARVLGIGIEDVL